MTTYLLKVGRETSPTLVQSGVRYMCLKTQVSLELWNSAQLSGAKKLLYFWNLLNQNGSENKPAYADFKICAPVLYLAESLYLISLSVNSRITN